MDSGCENGRGVVLSGTGGQRRMEERKAVTEGRDLVENGDM